MLRACLLVAVAIAAAGCERPGTKTPAGNTEVARRSQELAAAPTGLVLKLEEGERTPDPAAERAALAPARPLSDEDTAALLSRLPTAEGAAEPGLGLAKLTTGAPPPVKAEVAREAFPPRRSPAPAVPASAAPSAAPAAPATPPAASRPIPPLAPASATETEPPVPASTALKILRWSPEGYLRDAETVTVVFNQPMPTAKDDAFPVRLAPEPAGQWKWIDSRTAEFRAVPRFPNSTTYQVEIPAGTRSASGATLAEAKTFSFSTPEIALVDNYPFSYKAAGPRSPVVFVLDQRVDPATFLASVKITSRQADLAVRLATDSELSDATTKDPGLVAVLGKARMNQRFILGLLPIETWPADSPVTAEIAPGAKSAEGPNPSQYSRVFSFHTFSPFRHSSSFCNGQCEPDDSLEIRFSNDIDCSRFVKSMVDVTPSIDDLKVECAGDLLRISGSPHPRRPHVVKVSKDLPDVFGQTLGTDAEDKWNVQAADPSFSGFSEDVVLVPGEKPALEVVTRSYEKLRVKLRRVKPEDYRDYIIWQSYPEDADGRPVEPGTTVLDEAIAVPGDIETLQTVPIDLSSAIGPNGLGHVMASVSAEGAGESWAHSEGWVQSTRLGIDAYMDRDSAAVFVSDLATGAPAPDVEVTALPAGISGRTDKTGLVKLPNGERKDINTIVARRGEDSAILRRSHRWYPSDPSEIRAAWYVVDDRGTYRPGEEVTLKGWLRIVDTRKGGDVELARSATTVSYSVSDSRQTTLAKGTATLSGTGGFDARFRIPGTANLGIATVYVWADSTGDVPSTGRNFSHPIDIREFRRPEFEVAAATKDTARYVGESADVTVQAKYYSGGPLPSAPVRWSVTSRRASFVPPGHADYQFGFTDYSWGCYSDYDYDPNPSSPAVQRSGTTGPDGTETLRLDLGTAKPAVPMEVTAEAEVTDVNRQVWKKSQTLTVHPAALYVGLRVPDAVVDKGSKLAVEAIAVDRDGKIVEGAPIDVKITQTWWDREDQTKAAEPQTLHCDVVSEKEPSTCEVFPASTGSYEIVATVMDDEGRIAQTKTTAWVGGAYGWYGEDAASERVHLSADGRMRAAGETAEIGVGLPFYPAEAIVTIDRAGLVDTRRMRIEKATKIAIPIDDALTPNFTVQVDAIGAVPQEDERNSAQKKTRPAFASGKIEVPISLASRTLDVAVKARDPRTAPASETSVDVTVRDSKGKPVASAEVALFVVDETVLSLSDHKFGDPVETFHPKRVASTESAHSRTDVARHRNPDDAEEGVGGAYGESAEAEEMPAPAPAPAIPPVFLRKDMTPLAAFFPALVTDASGRATASFKLPDNVTRYRVIAVAAAGARMFGKGESTLTASLPLTVRPSAPRFLNFGDRFELPVVVQNQTDRQETVRVALRTNNLDLTAGAGREVIVPANDRVEVRFPAAAKEPGRATFDVVAASSGGSDAANVSLPVPAPAAMETFATYGVLDSGAVRQAIEFPRDSWGDVGGLDVSTASTNLQSLTDAFLYLVRYPYECGEQISSRILAAVSMEDVLSAFHAPGLPSAKEIHESVGLHLKELLRRQKPEGGFVFWTTAEPAQPFVSVHATHALLKAKSRGYDVPDSAIAGARGFLQHIESSYPASYTAALRSVVSSYALYVRALFGDVDVAKVRDVIARGGGIESIPVEASGWLLGALAATDEPEKAALLRQIDNRIDRSGGSTSFVLDYEDRAHVTFSSARRVDGVVLDALIRARPGYDLIPKLVTGLLGARKNGTWQNTQDNTFALLALDQYFRTFEKVEPDFVAKLWLGGDAAGEHAFRGRTTESWATTIAATDVLAHDGQSLTILKEGKGRLYYRTGVRHAPKSLEVGATNNGFVVERTYAGADNASDVTRDADGTWRIRLGARVRIRLSLVNPAPRYQVALVDPLPAGLEPIAPEKVAGTTPYESEFFDSVDESRWWNRTWFDHQGLRDDRAEAFASLLWAGNHTYEYFARATTPGSFMAPPSRAEEMYTPESNGRSASTRVVVQ